MPPRSDPQLDSAMATGQGRRDHQEDAVICDCALGGEVGLVVLSDGMGGYRCGDVASKIVLTEVYSELKLRSADLARADEDCATVLRSAVRGANACLRAYIAQTPSAAGMGATLVAGILRGRLLHWISIGDSPLYLFRAGDLVRLNADHSFGSVIRAMVADGSMEADAAERHPDRQSLISVISGGAIAHVDCPRTPYRLTDGDVLVFASDGLMHLDEDEIRRLLRARREASAAEIAAALVAAVDSLDDPEQDNVSVAVVRVGARMGAHGAEAGRRPGAASVAAAGRETTATPALCGGEGNDR